MDGPCQLLTVDEVVVINQRMMDTFGGGWFLEGDRNLANPGSLEHVLEEVQGSYFGYEPYPTVVDKACAIGWRIIAGHIFHDGNKRTGIAVCLLILELNGHRLPIDRVETRDIALEIAKGEISLESFTAWVRERVVLVTQ